MVTRRRLWLRELELEEGARSGVVPAIDAAAAAFGGRVWGLLLLEFVFRLTCVCVLEFVAGVFVLALLLMLLTLLLLAWLEELRFVFKCNG